MRASVRLPSISRGQPVLQACIHHRQPIAPLLRQSPSPIFLLSQTRTFFGIFRRRNEDKEANIPKSVTELLQNKPKVEETGPATKRSELAPSSIFGKAEGSEGEASAAASDGTAQSGILSRAGNRKALLQEGGLYPNEDSFMRKARIREIRRRGRVRGQDKIAKEEKEHLCKSHNFKTSLKKLGPLARQISGKPLEHALAQMKFSPKKAAKEVLAHLQQAKNEAIFMKKFDPAQTYIAQAWVGRGTPELEPMKRARSRIDVLVRQYTSISVILKENKTLERLEKQKEEKKLRQKVWVPMPNRPIYGQHQYYMW